MPQETKVDPRNAASETPIQGMTADSSDPVALRRAVELAVNYRGNVTLTERGTGREIECYLFDLKEAAQDRPAMLRYFEKGRDVRDSIELDRIASVEFSGKDTAAGRSFETWMKKYVRQKLAGQNAGIESESLDDPERSGDPA